MGFKSRRAVQFLFLAAFVLMLLKGRIQLWMAVFLIGLIGAAFFGRFYCGFVCPINTLTEGVDWLYQKWGIKRKEVPGWVKNKAVRYGVMILFLGTMVITLKTGRKLPVLPILTALGVLITLAYVPSLWHRYLCPYGILLNMTGSLSKYYWRVDEAACKKCGICERVCPAEAVTMSGKEGYPVIDKGLCLECTTCAEMCPSGSIAYAKGIAKSTSA
jgi:ferredoxin-type protein NapH